MRQQPAWAILVALLFVPLAMAGGPEEPSNQGQIPEDNPGRGMIYRDLAMGRAGTLCEGLYEITGGRAQGEPMACTHGPDPAPEGVDITTSAAPATSEDIAQSTPIVCEPGDDGTSGLRVHMLYVYEADELNRYAQYEASFPVWAGNVEAAYADSAADTGGERHVRFVHDGNCNLVVDVVEVADGELGSIGSMRTALSALGYNSPSRKYHAWADSSVYCGIAYIYGDTNPTTSTYTNNNDGKYSMVARTDRGCWGSTNSVEAHELMHNMGGVQTAAPHATNGWHCYDNADRMCYNDGGLKAGDSMQNICPSSYERLFDCNHDDYYHTNPQPGNWLYDNWNSAMSRFLFESAGDTSAPSGLTATGTSTTTMDLAWTDNSADETGFEVQRTAAGGSTWTTIATTLADATSHADAGLTADTSYDYRVRALRAAANSGWSNTATGTTFGTPPAAPSALTATATSASTVALAWTDNAANEDSYVVQRLSGATWTTIATLGADASSHTDTGLAGSTEYSYQVYASNSYGDSAAAGPASATTDSPPPFTDHAPLTSSTSSGSSSGSINDLDTDDGLGQTITEQASNGKPSNRRSSLQTVWTFEVGAGAFLEVLGTGTVSDSGEGDDMLFEWSNDQATWTPAFTMAAGSSGSHSSTMDGASTGTVYVRATDADRTRGSQALDTLFVDSLLIRVHNSLPAAPAAPSGLTGSASSTTVSLSWTDNADDETGQRIERRTGGGAWETAGTVGADVTSFEDTGLAPNTAYDYRVFATNVGGDSTASNMATVTTGDLPPAMHVGDLDGSSNGKKKWKATVSIFVQDTGGAPVSGAIVSGQWGGGGTSSCTTDGTGWCSVQDGGNGGATESFSVTDITGSLTYMSSLNSDPDGDSDGTTITVAR